MADTLKINDKTKVIKPTARDIAPKIHNIMSELTLTNVLKLGNGQALLRQANDGTIEFSLNNGTQWHKLGTTIQEVWTITSPQTTFVMNTIVPNSHSLKCYHVQTGQVYTVGTGGLTIAGQNVSFPAGSFDHVSPSDPATLIFEQSSETITRINRT